MGSKEIYGEINTWDVSEITDFSGLFKNESTFNSDISNWDVSSGTDFSEMFLCYGNSVFNQDIGSWDVSNVRDMSGLFMNANKFNQDIEDLSQETESLVEEIEKWQT